MKKFLAIVLALACVLSLCACGGNGGTAGNGGSGDAGNAGGEAGPEGKIKLSIGIPTNAMVLDHDNNALTKWIEEECNVELTFIEYAGGTDVATQISTTIAARQELPDILFGISLSDSVITRYGKDGYLLDLSEYYEDKEGASKIFWDRLANEMTAYDQDLVLRKITDVETGAIYCVPCVETSYTDKMMWQTWINQTWLDKLNLKAPTNNEELLTVLRAFKTQDPNGNGIADEIPLFGSQNGGNSRPVDWLMNLFMYYNSSRPYNVDANGKIVLTYTQDEYREGLKFINQLYKEELLTSLAWTASGSEMKTITTPTSGTAICGIFLGHLTTCVSTGNPVLYEYVPMQTWGYVVREDTSCSKTTFITENCDESKRDRAFEMLMKMWSWDGSMRIRYGEKGVNWDDPTPGAKSDMNLDATYKLIRDPLSEQSTSKWSKIASTFNNFAELETAEVDNTVTDEFYLKRTKLAADSYALFAEQEAAKDASPIKAPLLTFTEEEKERTSIYTTNVGDRRSKAMTEFCTGVLDPNKDADWNAYIKELEDLGLDIVQEFYQTAYDRGV